MEDLKSHWAAFIHGKDICEVKQLVYVKGGAPGILSGTFRVCASTCVHKSV